MTTPVVLYEEEYGQLKHVITRLCADANAKFVFLVDKNGQQIAAHGEMLNLDTTSLASLTAGNVAATDGLAHLIGERGFPRPIPRRRTRQSSYLDSSFPSHTGGDIRRALEPRPGQAARQTRNRRDEWNIRTDRLKDRHANAIWESRSIRRLQR